MKKFSYLIIMCMMMTMSVFTSCDSCTKNQPVSDTEVAEEPVLLNPTTLITMDRQDMFINHNQDYRWYETCMMLNNFLDEENDGSLAEVVNVFQAVISRETGYDTKVFKFQHFADGTYAKDSVIGFWVEDFPLNEEVITVTYQEAYDKLMATNCPKPHSRYVTLRKQVGPVDANPQYIFGNLKSQVYVDAVTGEVSDVNPAFGKPEDGEGFKMPLGEWP